MSVLERGIASLAVRAITGPRTGPGRSVNPERFLSRLEDPVCHDRCQAILTAFFGGFECGLGAPEERASREGAISALLRPFYQEGFAMGYLPNGYLKFARARRRLERFDEVFPDDDPFLFLRYVGLGFWLGFEYPRAPERMDVVTRALPAPKYRHLVHDGYGFKVGFFGHSRLDRGDMSLPANLRRLDGFSRQSAMSGLGRSIWFFVMDRPEAGFDLARKLGPDRDAVLGGLGLAAGFTFVDDLRRAYAAADSLPPGERVHFEKGLRISLYVRATADAAYLGSLLALLSPELRSRAGKDLERALKVGEETRHKEDFIEEFHRGCCLA